MSLGLGLGLHKSINFGTLLRPPFYSNLIGWYKGDLISDSGLFYLRDYSGNDYHALAKDSIIYLNGTDNDVSFGSITTDTDWTIGLAFVVPTTLTDATEYAIVSSDEAFIGHKNGDGNGIRFTVTVNATDYTVDGSASTIDDGQLHTIIASFRQGNQIALYIDGDLIGTTDISAEGEFAVGINNLFVGSNGTDAFTEMYIKTFEILDTYADDELAIQYTSELSGVTTTTYFVYEGDFEIVEGGFTIIEN